MKININKVIEENKDLFFQDATFHYICSHFIRSMEIDDEIIMDTIIKLCKDKQKILSKLEKYVMRFGNIFDVKGEEIKGGK